MSKRQESSPEEKQANKDIATVIKYFYETYKRTKPDASHYKQNYGILKLLMYPSEEYRTYSIDEIISVIDELAGNHVVLMGLTILHWPDLVRCFVDRDEQTKRYILKSLKQAQAKEGVFYDKDVPKGW